MHLLPSQCVGDTQDRDSSEDFVAAVIPESLAEAVEFYRNDLPHSAMFSTEYQMWVRKWREEENEAPKKLIDK